MKNVLCAPGAFRLRQIKKQRRDEEDGQNVPHPVKAEALASLVADDVADLFWDRRPRIGSNARRRENFGLGYFLHHRERRQNAASAQLQSGLAIFGVLKLHVDRFRIFTRPREHLRGRNISWQCRALLAPSFDELNRRSTSSSAQIKIRRWRTRQRELIQYQHL